MNWVLTGRFARVAVITLAVCLGAVELEAVPRRPDVRQVSFCVTGIERSSPRQDEFGRNVRPFDSAVIPVYYKRLAIAPKAGSQVTVVPLAAGLVPFNLKIVRVIREEECGDEKRWNLELEPVTDRAILDAQPLAGGTDEFPFRACVIFPAVSSARAIPGTGFERRSLPRGVYAATIIAAIDLDGDGSPDFLETSYCCDRDQDRARNMARDCDYTCGKAFKKIAGRWRLVESFRPC